MLKKKEKLRSSYLQNPIRNLFISILFTFLVAVPAQAVVDGSMNVNLPKLEGQSNTTYLRAEINNFPPNTTIQDYTFDWDTDQDGSFDKSGREVGVFYPDQLFINGNGVIFNQLQTITLKITNTKNNETLTLTQALEVFNRRPSATYVTSTRKRPFIINGCMTNPQRDCDVSYGIDFVATVDDENPNNINHRVDFSNAQNNSNFNLSLQSNSNDFSLTYAAAGTYNVAIIATDIYSLNSQQEFLTITIPENIRPDVQFSSSGTTVNVPVNFDASASSDSDGSIAQYAWDFNSDGTYEQITDINNLRKITSHIFSTTGNKTITLKITDDSGQSSTKVMNLNITTKTNNAPELKQIGAQTFTVGQKLSLPLEATDNDQNDILDINLIGVAAGSFTNLVKSVGKTNVLYEFTPNSNASFTRTFCANDNTGTANSQDCETVTFTEANNPAPQVNNAPTLNPIGAQTLTVGQATSIEITAADQDINDDLNIIANGNTNGGLIENIRKAPGDTRVDFNITPANDTDFSLEFCANDGTDSDCETVQFTVNDPQAPVNDPPSFTTVPTNTIAGEVGKELTFTVIAKDPENDTANTDIIEPTNMPSGAVFTKTINGNDIEFKFTFTPTAQQTGDITLSLGLTDGTNTVSNAAVVNITVTDPNSGGGNTGGGNTGGGNTGGGNTGGGNTGGGNTGGGNTGGGTTGGGTTTGGGNTGGGTTTGGGNTDGGTTTGGDDTTDPVIDPVPDNTSKDIIETEVQVNNTTSTGQATIEINKAEAGLQTLSEGDEFLFVIKPNKKIFKFNKFKKKGIATIGNNGSFMIPSIQFKIKKNKHRVTEKLRAKGKLKLFKVTVKEKNKTRVKVKRGKKSKKKRKIISRKTIILEKESN